MSWDGKYKGSVYDTDSIEKDLENYIDYGVVRATELPGGGTEVLEEKSDGTSRLNAYWPKEDGSGHAHHWVDSDGKTYHRD